jgi:hypothetical protein
LGSSYYSSLIRYCVGSEVVTNEQKIGMLLNRCDENVSATSLLMKKVIRNIFLPGCPEEWWSLWTELRRCFVISIAFNAALS